MDLLADELDYPNRAAQLAKRRTDRGLLRAAQLVVDLERIARAPAVSRVTPANGPFRASVARLPEVVDVLERLDRAGVPVWLDGGWGVDALVGRQTRAHRDLDLGAICRPFSDGETRTRTGDTTIFSRVLYQLSYLAPAHKASVA
jgi:hypothetical protein